VRTVLVAGAAGGVGEGIVRALLAEGELRVVATSRDPSRLALLKQRVGGEDGRAAPAGLDERLVTIAGDAGDPAGAAAIAERVRDEFGPLAVAIASLGAGWWEGPPLLETEPAAWDMVMREMLTTHFVFARTFVPELLRAPGGLYLGIGGGAAFHPMPGASIVSVAAAAQLMLTRALATELRGADVRIREPSPTRPGSRPTTSAAWSPSWSATAAPLGRGRGRRAR
jgi:NAD(P)-dependent dehydrogenase (short-subunit alcohol dehydrogenase family)